jgi:GT2 family glycosyltransferase
MEQKRDYKYKVAIAVLSYNGLDLLKQLLPKIVETCPTYSKVFVIDNASVDETSAYVKENFISVELVTLKINRGFTNGYIEGLKQIDAEYYVLISNDVEVAPHWVEPVIDYMENNKDVGAAQPKVRWQKQKELFEYSGAAGGYIDTLGYPFCRGRIFSTLEEDNNQYNSVEDVFWVSGCCFFVRSEIWEILGGFDNDYYAHMEDIDLSWRIIKLGYRNVVVPDSVVFHIGGALITYGSPQKIFRNYRNNLLMLAKNLPKNEVLPKILIRLVLDGVSGIKALLSGNYKETLSILKAHFSFYRNVNKFLKKRKMVNDVSIQYNKKGIYPKSIVWEYFIKSKKKFSDLHWKP